MSGKKRKRKGTVMGGIYLMIIITGSLGCERERAGLSKSFGE